MSKKRSVMDHKTLKALKGSIRKWELIVAGKGVDRGESNCPLCKLFAHAPNYCRCCPVMEETGQESCIGSPYDTWAHTGFWTPNKKITDDESAIAAVLELEFLKALLPK